MLRRAFVGSYAARISFVALPMLAALLFGCAGRANNSTSQPAKETQTGLASFYSHAFHGEEAANGETFKNNEMLAAHPSYPLGTRARVTNEENGQAVEVRIIDRGPTDENQREGVIIDLSRAAARQLGMMEDGRVRVRVEVLEWGDDRRQ